MDLKLVGTMLLGLVAGVCAGLALNEPARVAPPVGRQTTRITSRLGDYEAVVEYQDMAVTANEIARDLINLERALHQAKSGDASRTSYLPPST